MADRELLEEAIKALAQAASDEESIRFGHDVARVLHAALVEATLEPVAPPPHEHSWSTLGWDRPTPSHHPKIVQACACGEARELTAAAHS